MCVIEYALSDYLSTLPNYFAALSASKLFGISSSISFYYYLCSCRCCKIPVCDLDMYSTVLFYVIPTRNKSDISGLFCGLNLLHTNRRALLNSQQRQVSCFWTINGWNRVGRAGTHAICHTRLDPKPTSLLHHQWFGVYLIHT